MSTGPLPVEWAGTLTGNRGLWGEALAAARCEKYIHQAGLKIVGETQAGRRTACGWPTRRIDSACRSRTSRSPTATTTAA